MLNVLKGLRHVLIDQHQYNGANVAFYQRGLGHVGGGYIRIGP